MDAIYSKSMYITIDIVFRLVVFVEDGERELREISTLSLSPLFEWMQFVIHSSLHTHNDTRGTCESQYIVEHMSVDE
jgi:hypothetical protein